MRGENTLWSRHRPRRHRHTDAGRAPARQRGPGPPHARPPGIRAPHLGLEGTLRRHHQAPDGPAGASCDWSRERFTLDPGLSARSARSSCGCTKRGSFTAASYMVNWWPALPDRALGSGGPARLHSGHLWHIRYPIAGARATWWWHDAARTMLGIRPARESLRRALPPTCTQSVQCRLMNREIPIILDEVAPDIRHRVVSHPGARPQRFRGGPPAQPSEDPGHRRTAHMDRRRGPYAGWTASRPARAVVAD